MNSGWLMANNELLNLRDFLSTEGIRARLAVLSACETGIPDLRNGEQLGPLTLAVRLLINN